jgi:hypothetical protein
MNQSFTCLFNFAPLETGAGEEFLKPPIPVSAEEVPANAGTDSTKPPVVKKKKDRLPEVLIVRNWKEYAGESMMIIFSVVLALLLTEIFNKIHENQQTHEILGSLRQEIIDNKKKEDSQYQYHLRVIKNIDSALANPALAQRFIHNGEIDPHLQPLAPDGVMSQDLNDVAWQVAKQFNIFSKIDFGTYSLLTEIYYHQGLIVKAEEDIGRVILGWESRKPENLRLTLILMRDNYHAWAVDRAPQLLKLYQQAIDKLSNY